MRIKLLALIGVFAAIALTAASFRPIESSYRLDMPIRNQVITSTLRSWPINTGGLTTKKLHILGKASKADGTIPGVLFVSYTMRFGGDALDTDLITIPLTISETGTAIMTITADFPVMSVQANVVSTGSCGISLTAQFYGHP